MCSLAWAAWLVGRPASTFSALMLRDRRRRDSMSYAAPGGGRRWYFTARLWEWVDGRPWHGLRVLPDPGSEDQPP